MSASNEELSEVEAFRPSARPLVIAVAANVLLAGLCLGVPYALGKREAEASLRAFGQFSACLFDGKQEENLGLALPPGERAHFAAQVLGADPKWPARCRDPLARVAPEGAIFRWPSFKTAAADVQVVTDMLDRDLQELARARRLGRARAPERPLLILGKLRAALTLLARATGTSDGIDAEAIGFSKKPSEQMFEPSRLPLVTSDRAALTLVVEPEGLEAVALDSRGLSWLSLQGAQIDRKRVKRTSLVRGALRSGDTFQVLWAMPEERCAEQEDRCARRALGVAELDTGSDALPLPVWLTAHPAARFDRSVRMTDAGIAVLARDVSEAAPGAPASSATLGIELRNFARLAPHADSEDAAPLTPLERTRFETGVLLDVLLLSGGEIAVAEQREGGVAVRVLGSEGRVIDVATLDATSAFLASCRDVLAYGGVNTITLTRRLPDPDRFEPFASLAVDVETPFDAEDPARDRVRLACDERQLLLLALSDQNGLHALACDRERCKEALLARDVTAFDLALTGERAVLAFSLESDPTIVVASFERATGLPANLSPRAPAACWDPPAGLCGRPTLAALGQRVLLAAREGSDLLVLESLDAGESFRPLESLRGDAPTGSASQPMDQHRLRKGLSR